MGAHEDTTRIQVLSVSDTGRRRRWTDAEKRRIVEESHLGGSTIADVARRHEISRSMLYDWRYRHRLGLLGGEVRFSPLIAVDDGRRSRTHAQHASIEAARIAALELAASPKAAASRLTTAYAGWILLRRDKVCTAWMPASRRSTYMPQSNG